ncbi:MAG: hypothetical protein AB7S38_31235 [Vulcanimicrobiota bacterium]
MLRDDNIWTRHFQLEDGLFTMVNLWQTRRMKDLKWIGLLLALVATLVRLQTPEPSLALDPRPPADWAHLAWKLKSMARTVEEIDTRQTGILINDWDGWSVVSLREGDVVLSVNGYRVEKPVDFVQAPPSKGFMDLEIRRDGQEMAVHVTQAQMIPRMRALGWDLNPELSVTYRCITPPEGR